MTFIDNLPDNVVAQEITLTKAMIQNSPILFVQSLATALMAASRLLGEDQDFLPTAEDFLEAVEELGAHLAAEAAVAPEPDTVDQEALLDALEDLMEG